MEGHKLSEVRVSKLKGIGASLNQVSVPPGNDLRIGTEGCIDMRNTGALQLPTGNTSQRPGSPNAGYMRFNTETGSVEFYTGSTWESLGGGSYVTDGLIAYLDAGNSSSYSGSGSTWTSIAPAATNIGNWSMSGYSFGTAGGENYLQFNGSANSPSYDFGSQMTMEIVMWNQTNDSFSTYGRIIDWQDTTLSLGTYNSNQFRCWVNAGGGRMSGEFAVNSSTSNFWNSWNHAVMTYNGSQVKGYWNNSEVFSVNKTGALEGGSATIQIGDGDGYRWYGRAGLVRIYNIGLTNTQVEQNFNSLASRYGIS